VYQFADTNNVTVVGGSALSVHQTGGWLTGGGHSSLSNTMGLGVDNALQIKAVLPNGMLTIDDIRLALTIQGPILPQAGARTRSCSMLCEEGAEMPLVS
jgi:hypothetical protein